MQWSIPMVAPLSYWSILPMCRTAMARCPCSSSLTSGIPSSRAPMPTAPTTAIASGTPPPLRSKSSANSPIRPASSSIPDDGSSNAPSHGSTAIAVWPKTSSGPSNPQQRSSMPPLPSSSSDASLVTHEIQDRLLTKFRYLTDFWDLGLQCAACRWLFVEKANVIRMLGEFWPDIFVILLVCRSEEHTSAPVTNAQLVCRLLLEKKKKIT